MTARTHHPRMDREFASSGMMGTRWGVRRRRRTHAVPVGRCYLISPPAQVSGQPPRKGRGAGQCLRNSAPIDASRIRRALMSANVGTARAAVRLDCRRSPSTGIHSEAGSCMPARTRARIRHPGLREGFVTPVAVLERSRAELPGRLSPVEAGLRRRPRKLAGSTWRRPWIWSKECWRSATR